MVYDLMPIRTSEPMWSQSRLQGGCWYDERDYPRKSSGRVSAPQRGTGQRVGAGVEVLSPVIAEKAPGLYQLNRNTNWLCQSTRVPGSPQRASWPFRLNAMGAVHFATGIFTLPEAIALARPCESELLVGHGVGPDIAGRSR